MKTLRNNRITILWRSSRKAYGAYKWQIVILVILGFSGGLLEAVGINAIIPVFSLVSGESIAGADFISQAIEKLFAQLGIDFRLKYLLAFIIILFIFKSIALLFSNYTNTKITSDYEKKTRDILFRKTMQASWSYLSKQKVGYLETILMVDTHQSALLLENLSGFILLITSLLMYILVAINISFSVTLLVLAFGGLIFLVFKPLIYKKRLLAGKIAKLNKEVAHFINENIIGIKTIKVMSVTDRIINKGKNYFDYFRKLTIESYLLSAISNAFTQPFALIFIIVLFGFSYKTADFSLAAFLAIIYLIQKIFNYIGQLQSSLHKINHCFPFLQEILDYQESYNENYEKIQGSKDFVFNKKLQFKDVSFSYNAQQPILTKINFDINNGEMVGLIGVSGSGKTTIVDLILRLFKSPGGQISLDGQDIQQINLDLWRKNIGYVSQDMFLINDTIANNIRFYDENISESQMMEAAKMANIYDFIQTIPERFETIIGERGSRLSVGQRQRIVIARILAKQPKMLLLDEATSALDNESELKIQKIIEGLKGKITVLVIAHRLSTVLDCDKLLVLDEGKIIEQGKPKDLLEDKESHFYKLYNIRK